ncbi:MAG: hypothetical protein GXP41_01780 [Chloroflexi bacterium]|nr:hypothetical protein [Chloroflexota bacterium]
MLRRFGYLFSMLVVLSMVLTPLAAAQGPKFDATAAEEEGYWYSRYNLGNLVFRSGLGDTFMPEMSMMQQMVKMADADPTDGDTAMPPTNAALLKSVYASGDPHYTQMIDVNDFGTQRWDPASFDKTVTSRALGWTIIKESEWAKQFHVDGHFGKVTDNFGAQWRFVGLALNAESKMQAQYALQMLKNDQGLIANSDGTVDWAGQWVMLTAFSDLGGLLGASAVPHSTTNRYTDPAASGMFLGAADMLFGAIASRKPADTEEFSLAIQSLTWYAANTTNADNQAQAIGLIKSHADMLINASQDTATNKAFAVRGLIEAYRVSGDSKYLDAAVRAFNSLAGEFDAASGTFSSQNTYTIDNVAVIMGAINSARLFAGDAIDQAKAEDLFRDFFESAVNKSGLQQSVPPIPVAKGTFEQDEPVVFYGYPGKPKPPMAGGDFGIAPVFATEVKWDGSQWSVTNGNFDSAGAMHASNEFIWFHNDEVNGFPEVSAAASAAPAPGMLPTTGGESNLPSIALLAVIAGLMLLGAGIALRRQTVVR